MRKVRMLILAAFALFAFGAFAAQAAFAEDGQPALLLLSGNVTELSGTLKGAASTLESVGKKTIVGTAVEGTLKGCKELESSKVDTSLCGPVTLKFTGTKKEETACRSESATGEKDPIETILVSTDIHLASEETASKELQTLAIFKVLGQVSGESELIIVCGTVKVKVKGAIGCLLLPGLTNVAAGGKFELLCKQKEGKPEIGTCEKLCEWLKEFPFEATLNGKTFEGSAMAAHAEGILSEKFDIFLDD